MADLSRPAAPYLPPEITSRILYHIPLKLEDRFNVAEEYQSISVLARISGSFRVEVQKKLVRLLFIISVDQLWKFSTYFPPALLQYTKSLEVNTLPLTQDISPNLLFDVFRLTKNLTSLKIDGLSSLFIVNDESSQPLESLVMMPHLKLLEIRVREATILNELFIVAPNIEKLVVTTHPFYFPYAGGPFISRLTSLKEFSFSGRCGEEIVEGEMWDLVEFEGLTTLNDLFNSLDDFTLLPLLDVVKDTLMETQLTNLHPSLFGSLPALRTLHLPELLNIEQFVDIPPSITHLFIGSMVNFITTPNFAWFELNNLEVLNIGALWHSISFSDLPRLKTVRIKISKEKVILESLQDLRAGHALEKLIIGGSKIATYQPDDLIEVLEIKERCVELGIKLIGFNVDQSEQDSS